MAFSFQFALLVRVLVFECLFFGTGILFTSRYFKCLKFRQSWVHGPFSCQLRHFYPFALFVAERLYRDGYYYILPYRLVQVYDVIVAYLKDKILILELDLRFFFISLGLSVWLAV